jgi:hypothetical protein
MILWEDTYMKPALSISNEIHGNVSQGYMNTWGDKIPGSVAKCRELNHRINVVSNYQRCITTYSCDICKIYWKIDSGD